MTNTLICSPVEIERSRLRCYLPVSTAAVLVATAAFTAWGAHHIREFASSCSFVVVTMIGVYKGCCCRASSGVKAPAAPPWNTLPHRPHRAVPGVLVGPALVLGVAGALLGYAGRNAASGARLSIAAFVVGLLSSIGYVAIYVIDFLGQSGVG